MFVATGRSPVESGSVYFKVETKHRNTQSTYAFLVSCYFLFSPHEHVTSCLRKSFLFSTFLVFSSGETLLVSELILRVRVSGCSDYHLENDIVSDLSQMALELFVVT